MWVDDPHFQILYHVRHTAVPRPGSDEQLRNLAGRILGQRLDMSKPLWELYLIEGLAVEPPQTNMVFADLTGTAREKSAGFVKHLAAEGVLATGLYRLRFATHLDVDQAGIDRAIRAIRKYFGA